MKILIVDDDVVGRKILMIMLKSYGYCHEASSNEEAVALFRQSLGQQPYDVVFLEVGLQNTLQMLRQMEREFGPLTDKRAKCIIIHKAFQKNSGAVIHNDKLQWDGYLIKPLAPDILERELQRLKLTQPQVEIFNKRQLATLMVDVGDKEIVRELVIKFIGELPEKIMDMEKELLVGKYDHLQKIAHELVSISGTYGFRQLSEILRNIEQAAIRSDKKTMVDEVALAMKQCEEIQGPLADFIADCGVHDAY